MIEQLLPLSGEQMHGATTASTAGTTSTSRTRSAVLDELLMRYVEALVYQAVAENMASEQSARMVAMKAASDNAGNVIDELKLDLQQDAAGGDHQGTFGDRRRRGRGLSARDSDLTDLKQGNERHANG